MRLWIGWWIVLLACVLAPQAAGQWLSDTTKIWSYKRIGINNTQPNFPLHVVGTSESQNGAFIESWLPQTCLAVASKGKTGPDSIGIRTLCVAEEGTAILASAIGYKSRGFAVRAETSSDAAYSGHFTGGRFHVDGVFTGINRTQPIHGSEVLGVHANTTSWGGMYMGTNAGGRAYYGYAENGTARAYHWYDPGPDQWKLTVGGYTRFTVDRDTGYIGIGTTNPGYNLHVNGQAAKPGGGSWSTASDRRLKKNITPMEGALDSLLQVRGVQFEYTDPKQYGELEGTRLGVLAQDVQAVFPDWVDQGDDGYLRVTFRGFEGVAIEALRELRQEQQSVTRQLTAENAELKLQLREQAARFEQLATRLEALEERSPR